MCKLLLINELHRKHVRKRVYFTTFGYTSVYQLSREFGRFFDLQVLPSFYRHQEVYYQIRDCFPETL
nr:MAG TPA: hypothetical protein [Caudoviricetes sp.]